MRARAITSAPYGRRKQRFVELDADVCRLLGPVRGCALVHQDQEGHKVLIWSSFVRNVEYIAQRLADLGAVYIHGGVDAGDEDDDETREGKIRLFHDDSSVRIMVANPAAASEGVSLHRVCHQQLTFTEIKGSFAYLGSLSDRQTPNS